MTPAPTTHQPLSKPGNDHTITPWEPEGKMRIGVGSRQCTPSALPGSGYSMPSPILEKSPQPFL
jgi:hypothetical protein